eukprot:6468243-Amphidinium_carterae.1
MVPRFACTILQNPISRGQNAQGDVDVAGMLFSAGYSSRRFLKLQRGHRKVPIHGHCGLAEPDQLGVLL